MDFLDIDAGKKAVALLGSLLGLANICGFAIAILLERKMWSNMQKEAQVRTDILRGRMPKVSTEQAKKAYLLPILW
ncbi:MAG: hypothetical protein KDC54_15125 [Lewinella sp.]|nr:hypothetical protein [Lewinella sp.]